MQERFCHIYTYNLRTLFYCEYFEIEALNPFVQTRISGEQANCKLRCSRRCQNGRLSVLQVNIKILAKSSDLSGTDLDMTGIELEDQELEEEENCTMVIASNIVQHREMLQTVAHCLADGGCILAREKVDTNSVLSSGFKLNVVFEKTLKNEKLLLLRKVTVTLNSFVRNRRHLPIPSLYLSVWPVVIV